MPFSSSVIPASSTPPPLYFGGSRLLSHAPIVGQVIRLVCRAGHPVHVGCQFGADALVVKAASLFPGLLRVFAVAPSWSQAPRHVQVAAHLGESVTWSAGGSAPMRARYLLRSKAALAGCSAAVFFSPGSGSLAVAREAVRSGVPVFAFGSRPGPVPSTPGAWVQSSFFKLPCWSFQPAAVQPRLF